jgi:predicted metal-dependent hydrolase
MRFKDLSRYFIKDTPPVVDPDVPLRIRRQNRKSLAMRVTAAGDVVVYIPTWLREDHPQVRRFIADGLEKLGDHIPAEKPPALHTAADVRAMVHDWAERLGVAPARVSFRAMTRKWGSCSSRGSITLNTALFHVPLPLVEYVVAHELVHMIVFDHSPAFWALLAEHIPDCEARARELERYRV